MSARVAESARDSGVEGSKLGARWLVKMESGVARDPMAGRSTT
jgi:hypothetical protein